MIFLTSLIYVLMLYVIPGEVALVVLASWASKYISMPAWIILFVVNAAVYAAVLLIVYLGKYAYETLHYELSGEHKIVKKLFDVSGCRWLNIVGLLVIGSGAILFYLNGLLPYPFIFLHIAIIMGLLDILSKDTVIQLKEPFPPIENDVEMVAIDASSGKSIRIDWKFFRDAKRTCADSNYVKIPLREKSYQEASAKPRSEGPSSSELVKYVKDGQIEEIKILANKLRELSERRGYTRIREMENVVSMVRSIPYASDVETHNKDDYVNYPIETLYEIDKGSDCEDHAILAASILDILGHKIGLFDLQLDDGGHLALAYGLDEIRSGFCAYSQQGHVYYYVETVPDESCKYLGNIDQQFLSHMKKAKVIPVV